MAAIKHTRLEKHDLRAISSLMKDIELIERDCVGTKSNRFENSKLDEFQQNKQELTEKLQLLKQDIKTKNGIEERVGTNAESIKLKSKIVKNLQEAKELEIRMEKAYKSDEREVDDGDSHSLLSLKEIKVRQELVSLMQQDLQYTTNEFEPVNRTNVTGFRLAKIGRDKRRQQREKGLIAGTPSLTTKQKIFLQESYERDALLDAKLEQIKHGVIVLGNIAQDVNYELDAQDVMLDELDQKMDKVTDKIEHRNEEIQKLLDASGGATRWCPVLILCVILMACMGYIYNAFVA